MRINKKILIYVLMLFTLTVFINGTKQEIIYAAPYDDNDYDNYEDEYYYDFNDNDDYDSYTNYYYNEKTGYKAIISDEAELLFESEKEKVLETMIEITQYGSVAFKTIAYNSDSAESYAISCYESLFGDESGTIFLIDMDNRYLYIYSRGDVYEVITESYATIITDNVYKYATDEEYYECVTETFEEILTLLDGGKISQPMKYISNILLALVIALLINYLIISKNSTIKKTKEKQLLKYINHQFSLENANIEFEYTDREYSPQSSSSGGGSSGGGGGHSF